MKGLFLVVTKNIAGRIKPPWIARPTMTVTMYIPSCLATTSRSPMAAIFPAIRDAMPIGEYLNTESGMIEMELTLVNFTLSV